MCDPLVIHLGTLETGRNKSLSRCINSPPLLFRYFIWSLMPLTFSTSWTCSLRQCTAAPIRYVYTSEFRAGRDPRNLTLRDRLTSFTYFTVLCIVNISRDLWLFLARRYTRKNLSVPGDLGLTRNLFRGRESVFFSHPFRPFPFFSSLFKPVPRSGPLNPTKGFRKAPLTP